MIDNTETAILAGGCFWGVQELLRQREGVISTRVGYTGGSNDHPTYRNHPGHAEDEMPLFVNSPDAELRVVQGGQHFLSASNPDDVNAATAEFINRWR